jgi:hypothetical protein
LDGQEAQIVPGLGEDDLVVVVVEQRRQLKLKLGVGQLEPRLHLKQH